MSDALQLFICLISVLQKDALKLADYGSCRSMYSRQPYTEYISTRW